MLIINRKKRLEEYKMPKMPYFNDRREKQAWLKKQKIEAQLINVQSVDVQVKDIKQMVYCQNPKLRTLYRMYKNYYNDEEYINISKYKRSCWLTVYELLKADWILHVEDLDEMSLVELERLRIEIEQDIKDLSESANGCLTDSIEYRRLCLLKYKHSCLLEYIASRSCEASVGVARVKKLSLL